jgi:hypothetical protein
MHTSQREKCGKAKYRTYTPLLDPNLLSTLKWRIPFPLRYLFWRAQCNGEVYIGGKAKRAKTKTKGLYRKFLWCMRSRWWASWTISLGLFSRTKHFLLKSVPTRDWKKNQSNRGVRYFSIFNHIWSKEAYYLACYFEQYGWRRIINRWNDWNDFQSSLSTDIRPNFNGEVHIKIVLVNLNWLFLKLLKDWNFQSFEIRENAGIKLMSSFSFVIV